ncbi:MAG: potassium transporter TrkG, partial [Candidatus Binatia bacterium]
MSVPDKLANAWFMSTTARTAGFNTVAYDRLGNHSAYLTILLMAVGGSPGSCAGGFKTTTMAVLVAMAWSRIRGRRFVELHDRSLPDATVERTVSLAMVYLLLVAGAHFLLSFSESSGDLEHSRQIFLPLMFEAASATGTVGLSMGVTPELSPFGRLVIIGSMFVGRVGPIAFFAAISMRGGRFPTGYRPAREDIIVG